jgi:hypothetical protein
MKGCRDINPSMASLRHKGRFKGSAGSAEGWGTSLISS